MLKRKHASAFGVVILFVVMAMCIGRLPFGELRAWLGLHGNEGQKMTINDEVNAFIASQNARRGVSLPLGGSVSLDYSAQTGSVPAGGNAVVGIDGIAAGAAPISLAAGFNVVVFGGDHATQAAPAGSSDSYVLSASASGITVLDNNTSQTQALSGVDYLVFDGGATNADGSFKSMEIVAGGDFAKVALMYDAAFMRQPDLPGLEYNAIPVLQGKLSLVQIAQDLINSNEFKALYPSLQAPADQGGVNDQAFVQQLYGQILHRAATASDMSFYDEAMAGTLPGDSHQYSRAEVMQFFAISPENVKNSTWLIDTDNGVYTDPGYGVASGQSSTAVIAAGLQSGVINTALIDPSEITYGGNSLTGVAIGAQGISTTQAVTVELSSVVQAAYGLGPNTVIDSAPGGGSGITLSGGATANLNGSGNVVTIGVQGFDATAPVTINGFNSSDTLRIGGEPNGIITTTQTMATVILAPSAASPVVGANLDFTNNFYVINVGSVGGGSAAEVAAAANKVYVPADVSNELVVFMGETTSGNLALDYWHSYPVNGVAAGADANANHQVDVAEFDKYDNPIIITGVTASVITTHTFH